MQTNKPFIKGITQLIQGTHYNYTARGHTLVKSEARPPASEVMAICCGDAAFGLYLENDILFFLCKFGKHRWSASHYNWWLNPSMIRPDPLAELRAADQSILLTVELVDACKGGVVAGNTFVISAEPAAILKRSVLNQIEAVLDPWEHLDAARNILARSKDLSWMAHKASWIECFSPTNSNEKPREVGSRFTERESGCL